MRDETFRRNRAATRTGIESRIAQRRRRALGASVKVLPARRFHSSPSVFPSSARDRLLSLIAIPAALPCHFRIQPDLPAFSLFRQAEKDRLSWDGFYSWLLLYISYYVATHFIARADSVARAPLFELVIESAYLLPWRPAAGPRDGPGDFLHGVPHLCPVRRVAPDVLGHPIIGRAHHQRPVHDHRGIYGSLTGIAATFIFLFVLSGPSCRSPERDFLLRPGLEPLRPCPRGAGQDRLVASSMFG